MTLAVRERLLAAITAAVGGEYGLPSPEDDRDLPVTIVQDQADSAVAGVYGKTRLTMPVNVARAEAAGPGGRAALRAQAHAMLAAVVAAMHVDASFGGLAVGLEYTGGGIQTEVGKFVWAEASFVVTYQHARGNLTVLA